MGMWPFGKKKHKHAAQDGAAGVGTNEGANASLADYVKPLERPAEPAVKHHDAVNGDRGPYDGDEVEIEDFDFSDYAVGVLNLGSMRIPMKQDHQVQVEMGENGPRMIHIVTGTSRITPVAFAAPTTGSQWEGASAEILDGMRRDGVAGARFVEGPWGRELYGEISGNAMRVIGIDGPRWMLRLMVASPIEHADAAAADAYEMAARIFVYRGSTPMLAGTSLPVAIPAHLVEQVKEAMKQLDAQRQARQQAEGGVPGSHDQAALDDAAAAIRDAQRGSGA